MEPQTLGELLERGLEHCRGGDFAAAETVYRQVTREHPEAPDGWNMLAVALYQQGAFEDAAQAAGQATALRPAAPPYWLMRGNVALACRRNAEAQDCFRRAIALEPRFAEAHYRLGLALHGEMRCAEAAASYRAALRYAPDVAEIHYQLADALATEGDANAAMRAYQEAFTRDPQQTLDRRGCVEGLCRLSFDTLPDFWLRELERFFVREDVDPKHYVVAGLKALRTKSEFRTLLTRARAGAPVFSDAACRRALADPLFHALLARCLMADADFEQMLTAVRSELLLDSGARAGAPFAFLSAAALQSFNNEFVHAETPEEAARVEALIAELECSLAEGQTGEDVLRVALTVGCYRRLATVHGIDRLLEAARREPLLATLFRRSVLDARTERGLRARIQSLGEPADAVSRSVRGMYEEHPYPRWFTLDRDPPCTLGEWLARELPALPPVAAAPAPRMLVAGCGTGRDALWLATHIEGAHVLGVDLSVTSLSYAQRMADAMGVANIDFRHGDILGLHSLEERFDMIASTGVLHHMRGPMAGLNTIAGLLRPGGLMKLGFYSTRARKAVRAAREIIAAEGIAATEPEIRRFRQRVFAAGPDSPLKVFEVSSDFYSMSMCRDLLFHVQEHQYTLPELAGMLNALDLELLGLTEVPQDRLARYRRMFPDDARMTDVAHWDAFEAQYPDTFSRMFLFWCRSRP